MTTEEIKVECLRFALQIGSTIEGHQVKTPQEVAKELYEWVTEAKQLETYMDHEFQKEKS